MSAPIRILVALDAGAERDTVEAVLPVRRGVELAGVADSLEAGWHQAGRRVDRRRAGGSAASADGALSFAEGVAGHYPDRAVLLLHAGTPNGLAGRALAARRGGPPRASGIERPAALAGGPGASGSRAADRAQKAVARRRRAQRAGPRAQPGRMIVVLGPKGGAGKTLVSSSLAVTLAETGERVVLLDLDLQFGDAGLALGLPPGRPSTTSSSPAVRWTPRSSPTISSRTSRARGCSGARAAGSGSGGRRRVPSPPVRCRSARPRTGSSSTGSPGFTPEIIAAIDAVDRHLHGRHSRRAGAEEHEAGARDARADGRRAGAG